MKIRVQKVTGTELHHRYPVESGAQPCFVELDPRTGVLRAAYDPQIGPGQPADVALGHVIRWRIPPLRAAAANALLDEVAPIAASVAAGYSSRWDGNHHVGAYTSEAEEATEEIDRICDRAREDSGARLVVWQASEWFAPLGPVDVVARELGITASTTDGELAAIVGGVEVAEVDAVEVVDVYLRKIRDDLRVEALRAAEGELARLRKRKPVGRPAEKAGDERSRLIASACKVQGLTRGELADKLGVDKSRLAPSGRFAAADHDRLMARLRELAAPSAPGKKAQTRRTR